jgi:hypothetical protein
VALISYLGQTRCNHLGLIISDWEMIHQLRGSPSRVDYLGSWTRWAQGYLSHPKIERMGLTRLPLNPLEYQGPRRPVKASSRPPEAFSMPGKVSIPGKAFDPRKLRRLQP